MESTNRNLIFFKKNEKKDLTKFLLKTRLFFIKFSIKQIVL